MTKGWLIELQQLIQQSILLMMVRMPCHVLYCKQFIILILPQVLSNTQVWERSREPAQFILPACIIHSSHVHFHSHTHTQTTYSFINTCMHMPRCISIKKLNLSATTLVNKVISIARWRVTSLSLLAVANRLLHPPHHHHHHHHHLDHLRARLAQTTGPLLQIILAATIISVGSKLLPPGRLRIHRRRRLLHHRRPTPYFV